MKYFIFADLKFEEGFFSSNHKKRLIKLDQIDDDQSICFVIPNEVLKHTYHESSIKNKQNLYASIKNTENKNLLKHSFDEEVLECNINNHYYLIHKSTLHHLKSKLSLINDSAMIISDACFYAHESKGAVQIDDYVYLKEDDKCIKLSTKAANLAKVKYKKIDQSKFNTPSNYPSVKINLLTINQLFNIKKIKNYTLALVSLVLIFNLFGTANLVNNNLKIEEINNNKNELFVTIFPNKEPKNIDLEINNKLVEINSKNNNFSQLLNLLLTNVRDINSINSIDYNFDISQLRITCIFGDDIEQSIFIRNMKISGVELEILTQIKNEDTIKTEFKYDV